MNIHRSSKLNVVYDEILSLYGYIVVKKLFIVF